MTDPIADMLTRIRNAVTAKHTRVDMPASRLKAEIARILQDEGYIQGFKVLDDPLAKTTAPVKTLRLFLKYGPHGERLITGVQRISRPGRRVGGGRTRGRRRVALRRVLGGSRRRSLFRLFTGLAVRRTVLPGVVGDVPAAALELKRGRRDQLVYGSATSRALPDRRVRKLLNRFETMRAGIALIFVEWHDARCPYSSTSPASEPSISCRWSQNGAVP